MTLPSPSPIRQSYESLLCDIASLCIRIQNPIQLECNQTLRRISRRQWPTFSQSGAQKWSSHTLGRLNYATDSANAVWMCSGASHLRTAACRDSILESIICSPAALAVLVQTRKQWETQSNDFNFLFLNRHIFQKGSHAEENITAKVHKLMPAFSNLERSTFYQWLWVVMETVVLWLGGGGYP